MTKYRKKPVIVEAIQLTEEIFAEEGMLTIRSLFGKNAGAIEKYANFLIIHTLKSQMPASINDFIIKGIKGECYSCKPDIFEQTYELVE